MAAVDYTAADAALDEAAARAAVHAAAMGGVVVGSQHAAALSAVLDIRDLKESLKEMDAKLARRFHADVAKAARKYLPIYRTYAPAQQGIVYRYKLKRERARGGRTTSFGQGGQLRKSLRISVTAKGVRVMTGTRALRKELFYASIVHATRRRDRSGRVRTGNPYLWNAMRVTKTRLGEDVNEVVERYWEQAGGRAA